MTPPPRSRSGPPAAGGPLSPDDRAGCLEVFDSNVPHYFLPRERSEFEEFLADLPGPYEVLRDPDGAVAASGGWALRDGGAVADLCWGMVRRDLHGRGWGRRLTETRLAQIDARPGVRRVELRTSQHTEAFYRRLGFGTVSVEPDAFGPGLHGHLMVRPVPGSGGGAPPDADRA